MTVNEFVNAINKSIMKFATLKCKENLFDDKGRGLNDLIFHKIKEIQRFNLSDTLHYCEVESDSHYVFEIYPFDYININIHRIERPEGGNSFLLEPDGSDDDRTKTLNISLPEFVGGPKSFEM